MDASVWMHCVRTRLVLRMSVKNKKKQKKKKKKILTRKRGWWTRAGVQMRVVCRMRMMCQMRMMWMWMVSKRNKEKRKLTYSNADDHDGYGW